jgi:hypothetical protein
MASTYISKARRAELIDEFMDCWIDTESYSNPETADDEARQYRADLEALSNPDLVAEIKASGWDIL